jgi:hypothetical protein
MTLHSLYSVITLLAVAANPLLTLLRPCCCAQQSDKPRACCHAKQSKSSEFPTRPCCQGKSKSPDKSTPKRGCCCVKSLPAINPVRTGFDNPQPEKFLSDAALPSSASLPAIPGEHPAARESSRALSSGPALLAHLCVWLK